jgi:hypothetical protein
MTAQQLASNKSLRFYKMRSSSAHTFKQNMAIGKTMTRKTILERKTILDSKLAILYQE